MENNIGSKQLESYKLQVEYLMKHGETKTAEHFQIKIESLHRNKRKYFQYINKETIVNVAKVPKVLVFDVETSLQQVLTFTTFKPIINSDNILVPTHLLSWSGKWLNDPEVFGDVLTSGEAKKHNDKRIATSLWKKFEEADCIIAHNLKKFDRKVANSRFILNGLAPPSPYSLIDTLEVARKEFRFPSNRLNYLGQIMINDEKIHTNNKLWVDCFFGDNNALQEMHKYNKQDVTLLEEVYFELRPWMHAHPNMAIYAETHDETCAHCTGTNLKECGDYVTPAGRFDSLRCYDCGAILRRRKSTLGKAQRDNMLVSTAR